MGINDVIEATSESGFTFGAALKDAMSHGFNPKTDSWVVRSRESVTHFSPTGHPVTTLASGHVIGRSILGAASTDTRDDTVPHPPGKARA